MDFIYGLLIILGGLILLMLLGLFARKIFLNLLKLFRYLKYLKYKVTEGFEKYEKENDNKRRS